MRHVRTRAGTALASRHAVNPGMPAMAHESHRGPRGTRVAHAVMTTDTGPAVFVGVFPTNRAGLQQSSEGVRSMPQTPQPSRMPQTQGPQTPQTLQVVIPNLYHFSGHHLNVTYSTTSLDGQPTMTYQDEHQGKTFRGDESRLIDCHIGPLVSATVHITIDMKPTSVSLFIPRMKIQ